MIIGAMRPEEAKVFDDHAGYHQFHAENDLPFGDEPPEKYGSFEVFWDDGDCMNGGEPRNYDSEGEPVEPGWYWWPCFPGCMPESEESGPFATSSAAFYDADGFNPDNE
jgi:hypothetical protein